MPESEDTVRVRLDVPTAEHDKLRVLAAKSGVSMSQYCRALVSEAIRKDRVLKPEPKKER